ncbi:MAG: hypothetical protein ABSD70_10890 [Terracidiphilus sp.]|jgi:hypothetical protein
MNWVPVIWSVWGASILFMAAVILYASGLAKNEEDQLFLADSSVHEKTEQSVIMSKLEKIQPLKRTSYVLAGVMTGLVLVYYIFDMVKQFR